MYETIRWGIIGTGNIASKFAIGLQSLPDAQLLAVGSRSQDSADYFGDRFEIERRYSTYEMLAADEDIDAVYISTPHPFHCANTLLCLNAGKAVLTEKPFAINTAEANQMIALAREKKCFLMEAMWTRYLPVMVRVRELLAEGRIGDVRMLTADFGFRGNDDIKRRHLNPDLGGGGLLDVGIYPISLAFMLFGKPDRISSQAEIGKTGVDEQSAVLFGYESGQLAVTSSAVRTNTSQIAIIDGTKGRITIHTPWWMGERMTLEVYGQEKSEIHLPLSGNGYNYEAAEVARCLRAGRLESDVTPLDETLTIMQTLDAIRAQWGMTYPME